MNERLNRFTSLLKQILNWINPILILAFIV